MDSHINDTSVMQLGNFRLDLYGISHPVSSSKKLQETSHKIKTLFGSWVKNSNLYICNMKMNKIFTYIEYVNYGNWEKYVAKWKSDDIRDALRYRSGIMI